MTLPCCSSCLIEKVRILSSCFEAANTEAGEALVLVGHSEVEHNFSLCPPPLFTKASLLPAVFFFFFLISQKAPPEIVHFSTHCNNCSCDSSSIPNKTTISLHLPPPLTDKQTDCHMKARSPDTSLEAHHHLLISTGSTVKSQALL